MGTLPEEAGWSGQGSESISGTGPRKWIVDSSGNAGEHTLLVDGVKIGAAVGLVSHQVHLSIDSKRRKT